MKLTPAQQKVVDALKSGQRLYWSWGIDGHCFLSGGMKTVRWPTVWALEDRGILRRVDRSYSGGLYVLTEGCGGAD